jgi:hypothetical protein
MPPARSSLLRRALGLSLTLATLGLGLTATPASAYPDRAGAIGVDGACEGELLRLHNAARADAGLPRLVEDPSFDQVTRAWAKRSAETQTLSHNPNFSGQIGPMVPSWYTMGENVGYGGGAASQHTAYMNSAGHRANILSSRYQRVAVGCYRDGNGLAWTAVNFVGAYDGAFERGAAPFHSAGDAVSRLRWWTLGTSPSDAVADFDANQFLTGRADVPGYAIALTDTAEHDRTVPPVTRLYFAVFLREPDAGGLTYWIRLHQGGLGLADIATHFANSAEFQARYGTLGNRAFVDLVYRNVLHRSPDTGGLTYWTGLVNSGMTRGRMLIGFSESPEFRSATRAGVTVSWAYVQLLGRPPTDGERWDWTVRLNAGATDASLVDDLTRSQGFRYRAAASHGY